MEKFKVLIVEDEILIAENYKDLLLEIGVKQIEIVDSLDNALQFIKTFQPNLCLVDVRLDKDSEGIDFGRHVLEQEPDIDLVYLTAQSDNETIMRMVKTRPLNYISKPVRSPDLLAVVQLAFAKYSERQNNEFCWINDGTKNVLLKKESILFSQSFRNYQEIYLDNSSKVVTRMTTDYLLEVLGEDTFIKVNRSQIINVRKVDHYTKKSLKIGDVEIKISPNFVDLLNTKLPFL